MAMASKTNVHGPASYMQNTGFVLPGFPCFGAWMSYGLGSLTDNLPTFVVLPDPRGLPYNNAGNFSPGFLPVAHQGTIIKPDGADADRRSASARDGRRRSRPTAKRTGWNCWSSSTASIAEQHPGDSRLEARIAVVRTGGQDAAQLPRGARSVEGNAGHASGATAPTTPICGDFAQELPDRPAAARTRRAVRAGLERGMAGRRTTGTTTPTSPRNCRSSPAGRSADRRRCSSDLQARGLLDDTLVDLDDGVRPHAVHAGSGRPRPQRRHVRHLAGRGGHQAGSQSTARATSSPIRPPKTRRCATTCTPRSCTCWASTTRG